MRWMIIVVLASICFTAPSQSTVAFLNRAPRTLTAKTTPAFGLREFPLLIKKGKVLVEATLEGENGFFILDTGAPGVVINRKLQKEAGTNAFSISRDLIVHSIVVKHMSWAGFEESDLEALAVDLSHLEQSLNHNILGLIGYEMLKDVTLIIDFPNQKLHIDSGQQSNMSRRFSPQYSFAFELENHIPVVQMVIGEQQLRFGIDTGSGGNLIDAVLVNGELSKHFVSSHEAEIQGLDQQIDRVLSGSIDKLSIENYTISDATFLATDLTQLRQATELSIDGLLGYPFFKDYKCSFDFKNNRIYLW